ncbi:Rho GTPase activation protein [Radiomyces spectabilis]|uniref:Rho GTPase activation protein n=1 Tax=Radiomyces spectabilis TaxID=64574 RepID=UPI0022210198|nr:Rho GTPase activation protein [Radiomyces spectabilis]KAI8394281.1 Rho GTPase activation protein [Radiomyces spectabilis]
MTLGIHFKELSYGYINQQKREQEEEREETAQTAISESLHVLWQEIMARGLDIEGIFRRSGTAAAMKQLQGQLEDMKRRSGDEKKHAQVDLSAAPIHCVTGLLKRYLQQMSEPVIPTYLHDTFLELYDEHDSVIEKKQKLRKAVTLLPLEHLNLLQFILEICDCVCQHPKNRMTPQSMAIIFAPTCTRLDGLMKIAEYPIRSRNGLTRKLSNLLATLRRRHRFDMQEAALPERFSRDDPLPEQNIIKATVAWVALFTFMIEYAPTFLNLQSDIEVSSYLLGQRSLLLMFLCLFP